MKKNKTYQQWSHCYGFSCAEQLLFDPLRWNNIFLMATGSIDALTLTLQVQLLCLQSLPCVIMLVAFLSCFEVKVLVYAV